ncbi:MAG TPA: nicotinate phosphoribosyltransferase [Verrucomicrobiae bacterium]|nr:nicotinate phosphoribosyltransferase [Verrucomicrobiae bacterium]
MKHPIPHSSALLTDLYQLTMACAYWKSGTAEKRAAFHLSFRQAPFHAGFSVACGLEDAIRLIQAFRFEPSDIEYLRTLSGNDGQPLFPAAFLDFLRDLRLDCEIDAVPEGTVVFPQEPLVRVQGPILHGQLLETPLLNILNFQTLIATKAARICLAAGNDPVVEFGLRRAQGPDGALSASRAAYVGGCAATSNVLAGKTFGIPVGGTHAHSWVLAFDSELDAFREYARALPNNSIFLVDTYNSIDGVRHAVAVGAELRRHGHRLGGIRLDSGDLAFLSIRARAILDEAGFKDAVILGSNDLDEEIISSLKSQGATIGVWGVGTRLVTGHDQPALGGVYKLSAIQRVDGNWEPRLKLSEQTAKITNPGILQIRRFQDDQNFLGDAIYDTDLGIPPSVTIVDPVDNTRRKHFEPSAKWEDLLLPVFRRGKLVYEAPPLSEVRARVQTQLARLHPGIKRLVNPHEYPAGLELGLHELKTTLILQAREQGQRQQTT